jgi:hypothetical protein
MILIVIPMVPIKASHPRQTPSAKNNTYIMTRISLLRCPILNQSTMLFILQGKNNSKCCLCSCAPCLTPWRTMFNIDFEEEDFCTNTLYTSNGMLQHFQAKSDNFHLSTALTFNTCIASSLTSISLYRHCCDNTLPIRLLIHQEPLQRNKKRGR